MRKQAFCSGIIILTLLLSIVSLFMEQAEDLSEFGRAMVHTIDFIVLFLLIFEASSALYGAPGRLEYLRRNTLSCGFLLLFVILFTYSKYHAFSTVPADRQFSYISAVVIVRNIFLGLKIATRVRKLARILESIVFHPAQTILLSFFLVILVGALALMTPFATADGAGLPFLKAWFTSTSAVCVTGLIVADTATAFTLFGKITIMVLIQTGGLGIMIISYFTLFSLKKAFSLEDKLLISYMLSENDMRQLGTAVRRIILSTFIIESIGAAILTLRFAADFGMGGQALLFGIFHAVSAFCNAGFALFTDSLEGFAGDPAVSLTAAGLIIAGGISFAVIANVKALAERRSRKLSWNSRLVLAVTGILIFSGFLVIYGLEHDNTLRNLPTGTQYLAAFFQSVTVRTAGFNTLPIGSLVPATLLFMIVLMFIGGASGSTAGGIKVNTVGVLFAFLISILKGKNTTVLWNHEVSRDEIIKAFLIFFFGVCTVSAGSFILMLTEDAPYLPVLFETVSAFATAGLSTGITGNLSAPGMVVIILLMFAGRLGPLTVLAAATKEEKKIRIEYPRADVSLG